MDSTLAELSTDRGKVGEVALFKNFVRPTGLGAEKPTTTCRLTNRQMQRT